jgi:hypothetical protein
LLTVGEYEDDFAVLIIPSMFSVVTALVWRFVTENIQVFWHQFTTNFLYRSSSNLARYSMPTSFSFRSLSSPESESSWCNVLVLLRFTPYRPSFATITIVVEVVVAVLSATATASKPLIEVREHKADYQEKNDSANT